MHQRHNGDMPTITVRNVPPEIRDALAVKAARSGRSMQELLRTQLIEFATKPTMSEVMDRVEARLRSTGGTNLTTETILEYRDADRR